jgi:hypothetical protein
MFLVYRKYYLNAIKIYGALYRPEEAQGEPEGDRKLHEGATSPAILSSFLTPIHLPSPSMPLSANVHDLRSCVE